jgi:hypothetical protein
MALNRIQVSMIEPGGILPALDGRNLTNLPAGVDITTQTNTWQKPQLTPFLDVAYSSTVALNLNLSAHFQITMNGAMTLELPTNIQAGQSGVIRLVQDNIGGRLVTWDTIWNFGSAGQPGLSSASKADRIAYHVIDATHIDCVYIGGGF